MSAYSKLYTVLARPLRAMFMVKVHGAENMPAEGGYIVCANHTSLWDVLILAASLKRQVMYMAKKELFGIPLLGRIITALGAFPVNRGASDVGAIKKTISLLENGNIVGVFPQGTRYPGKELRSTEVKHGVGLIAYRSKRGAVPVYIRSKKNKVRPFRRAEIYIGEPIEYENFGFDEGGMAEYTAAAEMIFDRICTISESVQDSKF